MDRRSSIAELTDQLPCRPVETRDSPADRHSVQVSAISFLISISGQTHLALKRTDRRRHNRLVIQHLTPRLG
jgi:hypothetical protein